MADITVTQNVLVPMVREVHISHFSAGKKNDFSSFIFNIVTAPCNSSVKQNATEHQQDNQFFLHRIPLPNTSIAADSAPMLGAVAVVFFIGHRLMV